MTDLCGSPTATLNSGLENAFDKNAVNQNFLQETEHCPTNKQNNSTKHPN